MDAGQLGDDAWTSLRTLWREERWLPVGLVVAAITDALWLGASGAAVALFLEATGAGGATQWLSATTVGTVSGAVLWILGPAAVATVLAVGRVKNVNGNIRHGYRLRHPLVLLLGPVIVLGLGYGLLVQTGAATWPVLSVGVAGGVWLAVRTLAYTYRVFSLSYPILGQAIAFATATVLATATLVVGGRAAGREPAVGALLGGVAEVTGFPAVATAHVDTVAVDGVAVSLIAFAAVATPVILSVAYVGIQVTWGLLVRLYRPTVKRPELRTGQRYPPFARPTTRPLPTAVQDAAGVPTGYRVGALLSRVWPGDLTGSAPSGSDGASASPGSGGGTAGESSGRTANGGSRSVYRGGRSQQRPPGGSPDGAAESGGDSPGTTGGSTENSERSGGGSASDGSAAESGAADASDGESRDSNGSAENVSHTRVFTPPEDADFEATVRCPACGNHVDATAETCPACGAAIDGT